MFLADSGGFHPVSSPSAGLVRAQPEGLEQLEALGGLEVLGGALQSPHPPLRARAAFLLHCLLREHPRLKGEPQKPRKSPQKSPPPRLRRETPKTPKITPKWTPPNLKTLRIPKNWELQKLRPRNTGPLNPGTSKSQTLGTPKPWDP